VQWKKKELPLEEITEKDKCEKCNLKSNNKDIILV